MTSQSIIAGHAKGNILATDQGLSFWGGVDPLTGIATFQLTIPDLGPGVLVEPWIFQAYVCGSGGCTAGAATHTFWLDSSL